MDLSFIETEVSDTNVKFSDEHLLQIFTDVGFPRWALQVPNCS